MSESKLRSQSMDLAVQNIKTFIKQNKTNPDSYLKPVGAFYLFTADQI